MIYGLRNPQLNFGRFPLSLTTDIPFQLVYHRHYGRPLFTKSVVLAHDVDDFSKIWQAMGRSRTMNDTVFSIYKSEIPEGMLREGSSASDIKKEALTRHLCTFCVV